MFYPTLFLLFALMTSVLFLALTTSALPIRRNNSQPDVEARKENTLPPARRTGIPVIPPDYAQPLGWDDLPGSGAQGAEGTRGGFARGRGGPRGPRRGPSGRRFDARRK